MDLRKRSTAGLINAQESAQSILDKSNAVMNSAPLQYRVVSGGTESVVSKKRLSNGSIGVRVEVDKPLHMISIVLDDGNESFEIYPDYGVFIDTRFRIRSAKGLADIASNLAGSGTGRIAELKADAKRFGRECYVIESALPAEAFAAAALAIGDSVGDLLPAIQRSFIDKETYVLHGTEILSEGGSTLAETQYQHIVAGADLSDELFLPPNGFEFRVPESASEYHEMLKDMIADERVELAQQKVKHVKRRLAAPPPADRIPRARTDPGQIRELVESKRHEEGSELPLQPDQNRWRLPLILGINGVVLAIVALAIFRHRRRQV